MKEAATSDIFEIQSSQLAQERGITSEKSFGATRIDPLFGTMERSGLKIILDLVPSLSLSDTTS